MLCILASGATRGEQGLRKHKIYTAAQEVYTVLYGHYLVYLPCYMASYSGNM